MGNRGASPMNVAPEFTPVVKRIVIVSVVVWLVLQSIVEKRLMSFPYITNYFSLIPSLVMHKFYIWQPVTYIFMHSSSPLHILFNMLTLWWLGGELERRWGAKFFFTYYMVTGIGAGYIYCFGMLIYALITGSAEGLETSVVGASGSIFGLLLAYGIIFGERIVYFFMVFPMKAKWFVTILGAMEVWNLLNGSEGGTATLAHLGGLISGFLFLRFYTWFKQSKWRKQSGRRGRNLRLVVDNERRKDEDSGGNKPGGPKYWN